MITTLIFDIGNVLADFIWEEYYRSFGFTEENLDRLAKATVKDPMWNEYDRGVMTDEEVCRGLLTMTPESRGKSG